MALATRKPLLNIHSSFLQFKRFRGKINIQKPKPPHFERAKYIELSKPYFINPLKGKPLVDLCTGPGNISKEDNVENPFQRIIANELRDWFYKSRLIGFFHMNSMNAEQSFKAFVAYRKQGMLFKEYGKKTVKIAVSGTPYEPLLDLYVSKNMWVFSPDPDIRKMLKIAKKFPQLVLLAGLFEGKLLCKDDLMKYSLIPDLQTAQVGLVQTLDSVGTQIVSQLNSHQTTLVSHLDGRIKQLEDEKE